MEDLQVEDFNDPIEHKAEQTADGLNRIPGVYSPIPMGAFHQLHTLPY